MYSQQHSAYNEFNLHPSIETTHSYDFSYEVKQISTHFNEVSDLQSVSDNNIQLTSKSILNTDYHCLSQPISNLIEATSQKGETGLSF